MQVRTVSVTRFVFFLNVTQQSSQPVFCLFFKSWPLFVFPLSEISTFLRKLNFTISLFQSQYLVLAVFIAVPVVQGFASGFLFGGGDSGG